MKAYEPPFAINPESKVGPQGGPLIHVTERGGGRPELVHRTVLLTPITTVTLSGANSDEPGDELLPIEISVVLGEGDVD